VQSEEKEEQSAGVETENSATLVDLGGYNFDLARDFNGF